MFAHRCYRSVISCSLIDVLSLALSQTHVVNNLTVFWPIFAACV